MILPERDKYDVTIIGGGWAGQALARQLRIRVESLRILVLDSSTSFDFKVGEATIDISAHYLIKRLGLSTYLYRNHLPKNGLRFFFSDESASTPLTESSELGSTFLPPSPTFQLNRQRFDRDLRQMNLEDGVECLLGVACKDVTLGGQGRLHSLLCRDREGREKSIRSRWVVDASGRSRFLGRKLGLHSEKDVLQHSAVWGRFKGTNDIDSMGDDAWRRRVSYTARYLSTIHLAGWGYWIWFIPLSGDLMSVGIVSSKSMIQDPPSTKEEFLAFLKAHSAARELLGDAELLDFMKYRQLAYRCDPLFSGDRWAAVGFAGMFQDPYFSLGGDMISYGNDYVSELIEQDIVQGVSERFLYDAAASRNQTMQNIYARTKVWMEAAYACMGSFSLFSTRYAYELSIYYLDYVWAFQCDEHLENVSSERRQLMDNFIKLEMMLRDQIIDSVPACLENGVYYAKNASGDFISLADIISPFIFQMGQMGKWNWRFELMLKIWLFTYLHITGLKLGVERFAEKEIVQEVMTLPRVIERHPISSEDLDWLVGELSRTLASRLEAEFGIRPKVSILAKSLGEGHLECHLEEMHNKGVELNEKMRKRADELWMRTRPYDQLPNQIQGFFRAFRGARTYEAGGVHASTA